MKVKHFLCGRMHAGHLRREGINKKHYQRLACLYLVAANVGIAHNIPAFAIMASKRGRARVVSARQRAQYLCHVGFAMSFTNIGKMFLRDRTTIAKACQNVEESRDNPSHDMALLLMESSLRHFAQSLDLLEENDNDTL